MHPTRVGFAPLMEQSLELESSVVWNIPSFLSRHDRGGWIVAAAHDYIATAQWKITMYFSPGYAWRRSSAALRGVSA